MGAMITLIRPDGTPIRGYFANAGQDRPSVVVIQEWWGLNQQICSVADRFAQAGLNALAPDLYQGRVAQDPDEAGHLMNGLDFPGATHQDIRAATDYLKKVGSSVGVMGYCMGGALTIAAAVHVPGVAAAVCFYGIPPKEFTDPAQIRIPFQGHFANQDDWCTPQAVDTLEQSMLAAGSKPEIFRYDAAHAFCNASRPEVYNAEYAAQAWDRTLAFFGRYL